MSIINAAQYPTCGLIASLRQFYTAAESNLWRCQWTPPRGRQALAVAWLHAFLDEVNRSTVSKILRSLPQRGEYACTRAGGEQLEEFAPREARRLIMGGYEMRYEISEQGILFCGYGMDKKSGDDKKDPGG